MRKKLKISRARIQTLTIKRRKLELTIIVREKLIDDENFEEILELALHRLTYGS